MTVDKKEAVKTMVDQGKDPFLYDQNQARRLHGDSAGKRHVVLGNADGDRGRDHGAYFFGGRVGRDARAYGVGSDQAIGAVLLGGANGHHDTGRFFQIGLDLGPRACVQFHIAAIMP